VDARGRPDLGRRRAALAEELFEGGWGAISWPRAAGGRGASVIERWLFDEELDRAGAPRPFGAAYIDMIGNAILQHVVTYSGTISSRIADGRRGLVPGVQRAGAGSDLGGLRTRAARHGDEFVVTGQKVWTSYADRATGASALSHRCGRGEAQGHQPPARRHADARHRGAPAPADQSQRRILRGLLARPAENLLGKPGTGWQIAMASSRTSAGRSGRSLSADDSP